MHCCADSSANKAISLRGTSSKIQGETLVNPSVLKEIGMLP
jgi:hypothetical protein